MRSWAPSPLRLINIIEFDVKTKDDTCFVCLSSLNIDQTNAQTTQSLADAANAAYMKCGIMQIGSWLWCRLTCHDVVHVCRLAHCLRRAPPHRYATEQVIWSAPSKIYIFYGWIKDDYRHGRCANVRLILLPPLNRRCYDSRLAYGLLRHVKFDH